MSLLSIISSWMICRLLLTSLFCSLPSDQPFSGSGSVNNTSTWAISSFWGLPKKEFDFVLFTLQLVDNGPIRVYAGESQGLGDQYLEYIMRQKRLGNNLFIYLLKLSQGNITDSLTSSQCPAVRLRRLKSSRMESLSQLPLHHRPGCIRNQDNDNHPST